MNVAKAAAVSRKNKPTPMARPSGGNQSQAPTHDTARNNPITVATLASGGQIRSHAMTQRARLSARDSRESASRWELDCSIDAPGAGRLINAISDSLNWPTSLF